jgi:hypothetical protein
MLVRLLAAEDAHELFRVSLAQRRASYAVGRAKHEGGPMTAPEMNEWIRWFEAILQVNGGDEAQARRIADSKVPEPIKYQTRNITWADVNR